MFIPEGLELNVVRPSTTVQHIKLNLHAQTTNLSLTDVWGHVATYIYI